MASAGNTELFQVTRTSENDLLSVQLGADATPRKVVHVAKLRDSGRILAHTVLQGRSKGVGGPHLEYRSQVEDALGRCFPIDGNDVRDSRSSVGDRSQTIEADDSNRREIAEDW